MLRYTLLVALFLALTVPTIAQTQPNPECKVRVMVLKHNWETGAKDERQAFSPHQTEWWQKNQKKFPGVCLVTEEPADYLIAWTEKWTFVPFTTTVPVTTTHAGTVRTDSGRTATYETRQQVWNHRWVDARLFKLEPGKLLSQPLFEAKHHGRWMWSKPDKDAFVKTVKYVKKSIDSPKK